MQAARVAKASRKLVLAAITIIVVVVIPTATDPPFLPRLCRLRLGSGLASFVFWDTCRLYPNRLELGEGFGQRGVGGNVAWLPCELLHHLRYPFGDLFAQSFLCNWCISEAFVFSRREG
uniref:Putative secreted protein n=1 Tax=Ixodes ricinus TaxID=34613 RepID=A0A147BDX2_IXORI